ncbi:hypothetical protein F2P79_001698 [Pimephales promelas]|nr:hypothetical protein F2P79_001698 [Pimephales promelas]
MEVEHSTLEKRDQEVKKYAILPKFDMTVNTPQTYSIAVMGLKVESCANSLSCYDVSQIYIYIYISYQMNATLTVDASVFFNTKFEDQMQDTFLVNVNVTEEGTDVMVSKSAMVSFTNKAVYLLEGSNWPNKLLFNLTTIKNGRAGFSINSANLKADLNLVIQVTVEYSFVGEAGSYSADIIYRVLSKGVIVLHGFQTVKAKAGDAVTSGSVTFQLSVSVDMAPVVQILVYSVLPSEKIVAGSVLFDTDLYLQNQVSLQFSPATAVPADGNVLMVSAQAGSLCGLSAVDQSVRIMEPGRRLSEAHRQPFSNQSLRSKKYVLPKFDVTVNAPQTYSVAIMGLKVESCAKYTYGQPVPGQALVEVCRDPFPHSLLHNLTRPCLTQTAKMNATGYASLTVDASVFFNTKFEDQMQYTFLVNVNETEEGTDVMVSKSAMVSFTNKALYLLEGSNWPNKPPRPMPCTRTSPRRRIYADQRVLSSSPYTAATEGRPVLPRDQDDPTQPMRALPVDSRGQALKGCFCDEGVK